MSTALVVESSLKTELYATPNNYGVTHVAIGALPTNVAWSEAVVVRKYAGYPQNINDGEQIYTIENTNAIVKVDALYNDSGFPINGIGSVSLLPNLSSYTPGVEVDYTIKVPGVAIGSSVGSGALFFYDGVFAPEIPFSNPSEATTKGFAVNDLVTILVDDVNGRGETTQPNEYGVTARYHLYDVLGVSDATIVNPATSTATADAQNNAPVKTYYSLFIKYYPTYASTSSPTGYIWKKAGETSSIIVKDNGTVDTLASHLPAFYTRDSQTEGGNDLIDFLKVFAFHLDMYKAETSNVFYSTNVASADEELLKLLLKEFGVPFSSVGDLAQARTLAANIIKIYRESGSLVGLQTLIEAYTGYGSTFIPGVNKMPDYNTSSFEENAGQWYPILASSYATTLPYITPAGPIETTVVGTTTATVAAFTNGAAGYGRTEDTVTGATCTTGSTIVTGTFGSDLKAGAALSVVGGTGVLRPGTVVTSILSTNTFRINLPPSTSLSSADLRSSTNMVTGMGRINGLSSVATTATIAVQPKQAYASGAISATTTFTVSPAIASINDYVIAPTVPYGTYVVAATTAGETQNLTVSASVTVANTTPITFSQTAGEKIGSLSAWLPVEAGKPYSFSYFFNSGGAITTQSSQVDAQIVYRDRLGNMVGSFGTGYAYSTTVSTSNSNTNKWLDVVAQWIAPENAVYAEPRIQITNLTNTTHPWYVDAAQFNHPVQVVKKQIVTSTTAKLTTADVHNFSTTRYGGSNPNYVTVTGLLSTTDFEVFDGQYPIAEISTPTSITITIPSTSTTAELPATGWVVSNPPYEDARKTVIDVLPNRINLITNPSFEVDTKFWGTSTNASSSSGVNCTIGTSNAQVNYGTSSLKMSSSTAAPMSVYGHAGEIVSGVITNYTAPFRIDRSSETEDIFYTLSFYTKASITSRNCYAEIYWFKDDDGTVPSDIKVKEVGDVAPNSADTWTRYEVTGRAPEDARTAKVEVHVVTTASGEAHHLDNVLFERGYDVDDYFDGSFDGQNYTDDRDSMWETGGTPHMCRSHFYFNRIANTGRLKTVLTDGLYYA